MKRLAIYGHYGESPKVAGYVFHYLREIRALNFNICFVSNSPVSSESRAELAGLCDKVIERENNGLDIAMGRRGLEEYDLSQWDELLCTNSSIIGPLQPLAPLWQDPAIADADFWGLTDNVEDGRHLQSYFMVFRRQVIHDPRFMEFYRSVLPFQDRQQVIRSYEVGLTRWLEESGFKWKVIFEQERIYSLFIEHWRKQRSPLRRIKDRFYKPRFKRHNTTMYVPEVLLECGMPFLKAVLLREKPDNGPVSPEKAFQLLEASSLPRPIVEELRPKESRKKKQAE